jgi:hypothetical protein
MNIIIYSNCQGTSLKNYLEKKIIGNYHFIENFKYFNNINLLPIEILNIADIFIFQFTNESHGICSTDPNSKDNIFNYLKKDCIKIGIPSIFNSSFWPVIPGFGSCRDGHEIIKDLKNKYSLNEIFNLYDNKLIDFKLKERFNNCQKHTFEIEKYYLKKTNLDIIKITEFIENNYRNNKLFITHCHPSSYIFLYISNKIIELINNYNNEKITYYDNIFEYSLTQWVVGGDWVDSDYVKYELNLNYINNTNENITKSYIEDIYNNI